MNKTIVVLSLAVLVAVFERPVRACDSATATWAGVGIFVAGSSVAIWGAAASINNYRNGELISEFNQGILAGGALAAAGGIILALVCMPADQHVAYMPRAPRLRPPLPLYANLGTQARQSFELPQRWLDESAVTEASRRLIADPWRFARGLF